MDSAQDNWLLDSGVREIQTDGVIGPVELKQLMIRSDRSGLIRLGVHLTALCLSGSLVWYSQTTLWLIPATLLHGYLLAFLFCAQHETAHRTAFASKGLNDAVGHTVGFLLFLPQHAFRAFHWDHHRYTQDQTRDPELANGLPNSKGGLFWYWLGGPNWLGRMHSFIDHGIRGEVKAPWIPVRQHKLIVNESRKYLAGYLVLLLASVSLQSTALIWLWLLPVFCGYWFLRPYLMCEHTGCPHDGDRNNRTRTTFTNGFIKLFAWNMPYHTEHHAYPAVPFHALPVLHRCMQARLVNVEPGYLPAGRRIVSFLIRSKGPEL